MRATNFGDLWFVDHVDLSVEKVLYVVLVVIDASSNLVYASSQKDKNNESTISALAQAIEDLHVSPKAICGDSYFHEELFNRWCDYDNIKSIQLAPNTL